MLGTINEGDYIVVYKPFIEKNNYSSQDIVIIRRSKRGSVFVKRIMGQGGDYLDINGEEIMKDTISISHDPVYYSMENDKKSACELYVELLNRNTIEGTALDSYVVNDDLCKVKVPNDHYFVVGDNPHQSMDSRFWGFIHNDQVLGKVVAVL